MEWKVCRLKCPRTGFNVAVITIGDDDDIVVIQAFIRLMCDDIEVDEMPMDILELVQKMYSSNDQVHLFTDELHADGDQSLHFVIKLEDILSNLI